MDQLSLKYNEWTAFFDTLWEKRDKRMDGYPLMSSPVPTFVICCGFVIFVTVIGPIYMKHRSPLNVKSFLIFYNLCQVILSLYLFIQVYVILIVNMSNISMILLFLSSCLSTAGEDITAGDVNQLIILKIH